MVTVELCLGTSCHLMGIQDLMSVLESLPPDLRQNIEIKRMTCLNNCGKGPNIRINGAIMTNVTPEALQDILKDKLSMEESNTCLR